jgi:hypothetical protein
MTQQNGIEASPNIALLIDADNAAPSSLDPVLTILAELGTVNIRWTCCSAAGSMASA